MRWWLRVVVTLVGAPLLWCGGASYLASQTGGASGDVAHQALALLASVYVTSTLPAFALCGGILAGVDTVLRRLGLDLLTVLVSPALAWAIATGVAHLVPGTYAQAVQGETALALVYGLVWGLTIREPRATLHENGPATFPSGEAKANTAGS